MKKQLKPFILTLLIILADQISKSWIVKNIPENSQGYSFFNDALRIIHVRNTAVAFSLGTNLDVPIKIVFFIIIPLIVMLALCYTIVSSKMNREFSCVQLYALSGILGGGCGNIIDRIFRHFRVVDFISNKMYGILGFDRWPTYNIADSAVVISVIIIIISLLLEKKETKKNG